MPVVTVRSGGVQREISVESGVLVSQALHLAGYPDVHPCGGFGRCGKCAVGLSGNVSEMTSSELRAGTRLACQARILGDAQVILPQISALTQIEAGKRKQMPVVSPMDGRYGAAVDIGTTTLALNLLDLADGRCLAAASMENPQREIAADVIGRISAALHGEGERLRRQVQDAVCTLLKRASAQAGVSLSENDPMVVTGNTTMLYLLTGRSPESLSHAPFEADHLFGEACSIFSHPAYLPPCLHAFVGADIACALLESCCVEEDRVSLLCDIGTNGEIALWKNGRLYVTSTAAGPAFEGADISCGCSSIPGAIERVTVSDGKLSLHTLEDAPPVGLCGSGLIDLIAALLDLGVIDENGAMQEDYVVCPGLLLTREDVCAVQLAKAAIAAGIECLLEASGCSEDEIERVYLAGGFGAHLHIASAVRIGLIPEAFASRISAIGNAALDGAGRLLLDTTLIAKMEHIASIAEHVHLAGKARFNDAYIDCMMFPEGSRV